MDEKKRRRGDRKDGYLVRDADPLHVMMPYLMPNRADNEAVANVVLDMTAVDKYLEEKNASGCEYKYTLFHVVTAALAKTITLRPLLNRFISGHRLYDRKLLSFAFVVKKEFSDKGSEGFAIIEVDKESGKPPIEQFHDEIVRRANKIRKERKTDGTTALISRFTCLPRWIMRILIGGVFRLMDYYGKMPESFWRNDPDYATVFLSNLGSIKMSASYHHLANWGTNSFFVVIGEKKPMPFVTEDGKVEVRQGMEIGMTIDERIADGFYFAKSIKLFKTIIENPELLDKEITSLEGLEEQPVK
ncbi:MAG: hypothetical protein E7665_07685 [Ruminococcaceae bacterium]|nr:hypothetical protein [Oscillospiraceae bacterium]